MNLWISLTWYIASILIIYLAITLTKKFKFKQINIKKIIISLKSKSKNNISPLASLSTSLAAKIGVGSLSGIALAIYYGGIGSIFWIIIISLLVSINTYYECILGIKYRDKEKYIGGPSYYIKKCLGNKKLSILYSILIIITYSGLFLSIQANTIVSITNYFNIDKNIVIISLSIIVFLIIIKGIGGVINVNKILVPIMLIFYFLLGLYVINQNYLLIPQLIINVIKEAVSIKSIIPVFLIGMQRAIFISESSIGTSAISASTCDTSPDSQGLIEVLGIYITIFIVSITTFFIIATSNYNLINFSNLNGIELVIYAFNYHFGHLGSIILSIITIMFAFSTIIASYFFGESNLLILSKKNNVKIIFKLFFIVNIIISCYIQSSFLWNITDFLVATLVIINTSSMIRINNNINHKV